MAELNLQEIEKKLNTEFENGQRLVFWYDADGSFSDMVDQLKLGAVEILHLTERNAFRIKLLIEHENPEGQYLIYAPFEKPPVSKNHLEDTLLYSKAFYADKLSLIAADIGLPSRLRSSLESLKVFFAVGKGKMKAAEKKAGIRRANAFIERAKEMDLSSVDQEMIPVIAMCVVAKARNTTVDGLFYAVLSYGDIREQRIITEFSQNGLTDVFWNLCESRFGYTEAKPSLLKFVITLFAVYTCKDYLTAAPSQWKLFMQERMKRKVSNISVMLENMMNNMMHRDCFDTISQVASQELDAAAIIQSLPLESILHTASFALIDHTLMQWIIERELAEDCNASISGCSIPDICEERLRLHFGTMFSAEYEALLAGFRLLKAAHYVPAASLSDLIQNYCKEDYKIDTEYRRFISALERIEDKEPFEQLAELLQNVYITNYLEKIVYQWNVAYEENAFRQVIAEQKNFYQEKVAPMREKVVVIVSDGLRYEAAKELERMLREDENSEVSMSAMMTSLPSITILGNAQLLPHEEITLTDEKTPTVLLDGRPTGTTVLKEKILQAANPKSAAISFDAIKALKSKVRDYTAGKQVIYVFHNQIDTIGEALQSENRVFEATSQTIRELFDLVKWLRKNGNVYRFLITADHGYIYTRRKLASTDKLENLAGKWAFTDRRFIISEDKHAADGVYALSMGEALGNSDHRYIMLAKGMSVFKCGGGMNYVHGGASPQEMIVPCLFIKTQKGIVETENVRLNLITDVRKITNLKLKLDFYQEQAVSDVVKAAAYRIRFESDSGEIISNEVLHAADSEEEKPANRIVTLSFDIKKKSYDSNRKHYLKVLLERNGAEIMSRQVIMDLPFTEDFGFEF